MWVQAALAFAFALLTSSCGAKVVLEESDETDPAPTAKTPDPCAGFTNRQPCCDAGCNLITQGPGPSGLVCQSPDRDCSLDPGVCADEEVCEVYEVPGNGGCSWGLTIQTLGRCAPR